MAITRWDPYREFNTLQDRMNRMFNEMYGHRGDEDVMTSGSWIPAVDIFRTGEAGDIVLKAELPGLTKDDIELRIENNTLTLKGERKLSNEIKEDQYHRVERSYGSFSRSFSLPADADTLCCPFVPP